LENPLNIPKPVWFMLMIVFAVLATLTGTLTYVDLTQFKQIETLSDTHHDLDKQVAVLTSRVDLLTDLVKHGGTRY
jgi:hypothetical protein